MITGDIGWSWLGYERQTVTHYWREAETREAISLCGRGKASRPYLDSYAKITLPDCRSCQSFLKKRGEE